MYGGLSLLYPCNGIVCELCLVTLHHWSNHLSPPSQSGKHSTLECNWQFSAELHILWSIILLQKFKNIFQLYIGDTVPLHRSVFGIQFPCPSVETKEWMKNVYTLHSRKTDPKAQRQNKMTRSRTYKNKKVIIKDDSVQYPDGSVTIDEWMWLWLKILGSGGMVNVMDLKGLAECRDWPSTTHANGSKFHR